MEDRMGHAEGHIGELQCCGCPTANIHDIPPSLLAEIFASLEAYSRIRLRRLFGMARSAGFTSSHNQRNLPRHGHLYLKTDKPARLETFINGKNFTFNYE
ncbi:hypothetical protein RvY_02246 [Ramazzottius varieornatus]|uniref:F-box domain-containing protein n=1 Tax=Ramazzottius varieornatus TaxID=947166 RepID=A0A1D1UJ21_RAMVA|nr:hypothetical protein RvY_02246 [Ramazzottius varieornatus]